MPWIIVMWKDQVGNKWGSCLFSCADKKAASALYEKQQETFPIVRLMEAKCLSSYGPIDTESLANVGKTPA